MKEAKSSTRISKPAEVGSAELHGLLSIVEKSQVPFGESASLYNRLKIKIEADEQLSTEEYEQLLRLVKIAEEWEKGVESSALTEREETLAG